ARIIATRAAGVEKTDRTPRAVPQHFDLGPAGRVHQEGALDTDTVSHPPNRDVAPQASAGYPDHKALEDLDAFACTLDDLGVHLYAVARAQVGRCFFLLLLLDLVDDVHDNLCRGEAPPPGFGRRARAGAVGGRWLGGGCRESGPGGTFTPRHWAGRVNCGYPPPAPSANASCASDASSPSTPGTRRATASISTMAGNSPPVST